MDVDVMDTNKVVIGNCSKCDEKKVLVTYMGDGFCTKCIREDDHLSAVVWRN